MKRCLIKRKKRKGFTLIELLAVILVLGFIALIAVPTVNNVIEQSRKGSANTSAQSFIKAVEEKVLYADMNYQKYDDGDYFLADLLSMGINVAGELPDSAIITIENSKIVDYQIMYGDYLINNYGEYRDSSITRIDNTSYVPAENSSYLGMLYYNPNTGTKCTKEDFEANLSTHNAKYNDKNGNKLQHGLNSGCMIWYIYKDNGDDTVNMILNHNLDSYGTYSNGLTYMKNQTSDWKNTPSLMKYEDLDRILGLKKYLNIDLNNKYVMRTDVNLNDNYFDIVDDDSFSAFKLDDLYVARNEKDRYRYFWLLENSPFNLSYAKMYIPKVCKGMTGDFNVGYFIDGTVNFDFMAQDGKKGYWTIGSMLIRQTGRNNDYISSNNGHIGFTNHAYVRPVITISKSVYE